MTMPKIPLVNLERLHQSIRPEIDAAIKQVLDSGRFINGPEVKEFEDKFAELSGLKHMIGCANGTDAITVLLAALGIGPGDEVIVPTMTFIATAESVTAVGAQVVFADIRPDNYCIDENKLEGLITKHTRAVIAVNLHGNTANLSGLATFCKAKHIQLIEDSAQAHLAKHQGRPVGSYGVAATFSFFPGKNLGALGDAGAIGTNDDELAKKLRKLINHGRMDKYKHDLEGYNMRIDTLQTAVLSAKLKYLPDWTEKRRMAAHKYRRALSNLPVVLPIDNKEDYYVYHLFVIKVKDRDNVVKHLNNAGIDTGVHYPIPLHLQPAYAYLGHKKGDFPVAEACAEEFLSLPICPELTEAEQKYIITELQKVL